MKSVICACLLGMTVLGFSTQAFSDCSPSSAPQGWGGSWWSSYKSWCRGCGGTICDAYNDCGASCKLPAAGSATSQSAPAGNPNTPITNSIMSAMPAPANLSQAFNQGLTSGLLGSLEQNLNASARPLTPEELRAQQEEEERQRQAEIARQQELERQKQQKVASLDQRAFEQLSLLDAPLNPSKPITHDTKPSVQCTDDQRPNGDFICHVTVCGGAYNGASVCCPNGYPKLNECDCQCYPGDSNFECSRYAACENSANFNPTKASTQGK